MENLRNFIEKWKFYYFICCELSVRQDIMTVLLINIFHLSAWTDLKCVNFSERKKKMYGVSQTLDSLKTHSVLLFLLLSLTKKIFTRRFYFIKNENIRFFRQLLINVYRECVESFILYKRKNSIFIFFFF